MNHNFEEYVKDILFVGHHEKGIMHPHYERIIFGRACTKNIDQN